jgi:site-specific DNA-methyltransferase (adenine-specific)
MNLVNYNPDIISCLANLSTDEVFTSPQLANEVLDLLPSELWQDPNSTFLDPSCKSGVFLREIAKRLIHGLEISIPNLQQRLNHIFTQQIYGIALTEITSLVSRRSIYCSRLSNSEYSICKSFNDVDGNVRFGRVEHTWIQNQCLFCKANKSVYERGDELESHAYEFIHRKDPKDIFNMKFDVIIGNPPYHLSDSGESTGSSPIYQLFVQQAKKLAPRYLAMIIPSRWFAGGKGLDEFRSEMLNDERISKLVDYPITADVFPGLKVIGGVCYFLWEANHKGHCKVSTKMNGIVDTMSRPLNKYDTFVRFNKAISIIEKVELKKYDSFFENVSTQKPFGLRTYEQPTGRGSITLYANKKVGKIEKTAITKNKDLIEKWKVFISMGYGEGGETREYPRMILGKPIVASPGSACTETYLVVGAFDTEEEANNLDNYLRSKFVRFLVGLRKNTQHITRDRFKFVPNLSMNKKWTDAKLYKHFNISNEEIEFIDAIIRPMDLKHE